MKFHKNFVLFYNFQNILFCEICDFTKWNFFPLLFGRGKGLSSHYEICNDTYIFKIRENTWVKINPVGDIPCARAVNSACALDINHMAIYGGTTLNGILASDELYALNLNNEETNSKWIKLKKSYENISPGKRYGH